MNHRIGRAVFATVVGLGVALYAYQWITDPASREQRRLEERVVMAARQQVAAVDGLAGIEFVDPLQTNRKVGKVYVFEENGVWSVSGYYRRDAAGEWYPFLATLDAGLALVTLRVRDAALVPVAASDERLQISR